MGSPGTAKLDKNFEFSNLNCNWFSFPVPKSYGPNRQAIFYRLHRWEVFIWKLKIAMFESGDMIGPKLAGFILSYSDVEMTSKLLIILSDVTKSCRSEKQT